MDWFKSRGIKQGNPEDIEVKYMQEKRDEILKVHKIDSNGPSLLQQRRKGLQLKTKP